MPGRALKIAISLVLTVAALVLVAWNTDVDAIVSASASLSFLEVTAVCLALLAGALLASVRIWMIAHDLGYRLPMRDAVAVLSVGNLAGTFFFQIVGQLMARGALLARSGLPVSVTVVLTGYERIVAMAVSLAFALAGGWLVFGRLVFDLKGGGLDLLHLVAGLLVSVLAGAILGWGRKASDLLPRFNSTFALRASRSILVSAVIQCCTMAAYVIAAKALSPQIAVTDLAAAAAVVMLAASLPISLAGWGVRELSAVLALGAIGMPPEKALIVALLVGVGAIGVVGVLALISCYGWKQTPVPVVEDDQRTSRFEITTVLVWSVALATATAVFFQVYVPVGSGRLNLNFADPLAILGGALFLIWAFRDRAWPLWRLPLFNAYIIVATCAVLVAFAIGYARFGWTSWAATNKLAGWFILLSYGATGALLTARAGREGYTVMLRTVAAVACAIALGDSLLIALRISGVSIPFEWVDYRIEGFAINPNAFVLQLLLAACATALAFRSVGRSIVMLTILMVGIWLTGSRAGYGAAACVLLALSSLRPAVMPRLFAAGVAAIVIAALLPVLGHLAIAPVLENLGIVNAAGAPEAQHYAFVAVGADISDKERFITLGAAWEMFKAMPLFGAGLGAFVHEHMAATGVLLVIHSTPLWLLAEFGILGTVAIAAPVVHVAWHEVRRGAARDDAALMLVLAILALGVMSLVHEMMYQRLFWLLLGASMALMPTSASSVQRSAPL